MATQRPQNRTGLLEWDASLVLERALELSTRGKLESGYDTLQTYKTVVFNSY